MSEIKINLGCGGNILEGFDNRDIDTDITKRLPWDDGSVDLVLAEHVFEHIAPPEGIRFLEDCRRILKDCGTLRLCVPVVGVHLKREHAKDLISGHGHLQALDRNIVITMLWAAGFELDRIKITDRSKIDGHHKVIGIQKDDAETLRVEATK